MYSTESLPASMAGEPSNGGIGGGTLTINDSTFSGDSATATGVPGLAAGGAIYLGSGTLTINNSTFSGNAAAQLDGGFDSGGGAIYALNGGTVTINGSTVSGNSASAGSGGGIDALNSALTITGSTFSGNSAGGGGGIYTFQSYLTINNSTFSGNQAIVTGGGIYDYESILTINNSTFSGNTNGGIFSRRSYLTNTIVADTPGITFVGVNNLTNSNPLLAPLGNYGGPTQTMPPLPGSPAIDAGLDSVTNFLATDQRGYPRLSGAHVDIGAVEAQWASEGSPPLLTSPAPGANGAFSFAFNNASNTDFTVLATTNIALPLGQWSILGQAVQNVPGQYQFTDAAATNYPQQFYRVVSP
jgi:hypothetical protein